MTSPESPAGARRRVRLALREARLAKGETQGQVAEAMEWSQSKVIRIESGEVTISPNDLRPLLAHLGITDKATVDKLVQDARASRRRAMWWDEPRVREHLTPASRQLIQYEREAVAVRHFSNIMIPGALQTAAMATAILSGHSHHDGLTGDQIAVRLETRARRRAELLARRDFPATFLLLEESVLRRRVGDARTTGEQLLDLLKLSREKPISVRVLPYTADAPLPVIGPFDILTLAGSGSNEVLYRESHLTDEIVEDPANVTRHRALFDTWWEAALDEPSSAQMVEQSAKEFLESSQVASGSPPPPTTAPPRARSARSAKATQASSRSRRPPP
jgi:transcriptional regulator with XRE-family HTH domain